MVVLTTHPYPAPRLKKEHNYTSIPPHILMAYSTVNLTFLILYG